MKPNSNFKSRQLIYLNSQMAQLQANLSDMESHLRVTMVHAEYIRKLGILHGSLLMATHRVFEQEDLQNQDDEDDVDQS